MTLFTFRPKFKLAAVLCVTLFCLAITGLLAGRVARANPDHNAGDYFMFARAAGDGGTDDPKAYEPVCDDANDKQADVSGSDNNVYGRIHSNADLAISGTGNRFFDSGSPNPELTYGVNDGPTSDC